MTLPCVTCQSESSKYKCSTCFSPYCSSGCWAKHKEDPICVKPLSNQTEKKLVKERICLTEDTVPREKLIGLGSNKELKQLLKDPLLQKLITAVDSSQNPNVAIQKAMQDPSFVKFVDVCLELVEHNSSEND